jgi:hypothetical protein
MRSVANRRSRLAMPLGRVCKVLMIPEEPISLETPIGDARPERVRGLSGMLSPTVGT